MIPPTSIDGTDITGATIDGTDVQEITVDGDVVFSAEPQVPTQGLLHHWDWSAPSSTTSFVEDLAGSVDATGTFNGFGTINGKQSGSFTGGANFETSSLQSFSSNRLIATVFQSDPAQTSATQAIWDNASGDQVVHWEKNGFYRFLQQGPIIQGGNSSAAPHISLVQIDTTDIIRIDGNQIASGDAGNETMNNMQFGTTIGGGVFDLLGEIGEILMYDLSNAPPFSDIEDYLSASWGNII